MRTRQIPTEFRYWDNANKPWVRYGRTLSRRVVRFDPLPPEQIVRRFAEAYYDADPVAEAFVDEVYLTGGATKGRAMLDQALDHGIESVPDAPESMKRLFEEFERDPCWVDHDKVALGARVFRRYGTAVFSFAGVTTLEMYSESSVAKPLALTGAYAGDSAHHRFMETVRFWIDVSNPGGLQSGRAGRAAAMRVRVMHVFIRRRLTSHPEWDLTAWGVPISQGDASLTLMGGSLTPGLGLWSMGYQTTIAEIEAMMHFWRYVGHLMGVQPTWYPETFREGLQLMSAALLKRAYAAGKDGEELIESYPRAFAPNKDAPLPKRLRDGYNYRIQLGYTRFFSNPRTYARHTMPNPWPWALHPLLQFPINFTLETVRRRVPAADRLADRIARHHRERWYRHQTGRTTADFHPAQNFRR